MQAKKNAKAGVYIFPAIKIHTREIEGSRVSDPQVGPPQQPVDLYGEAHSLQVAHFQP